MTANLTNLSAALDQAAPDKKLAELIRTKMPQIQSEIASKGFSIVTMNGQEFRVVPKTGLRKEG